MIVDVLDDINKSMETVVKAESGIYQAAAANIEAVDDLAGVTIRVGKAVVIAIGVLILAMGLLGLGNAFPNATPVLQTPQGEERTGFAQNKPNNEEAAVEVSTQE